MSIENMFRYITAVDTIGWFLGANGWSIVRPLLIEKMNKEKIIELGFTNHDGIYLNIRMNGD